METENQAKMKIVLLTRKEAAERLRISLAKLDRDRIAGDGHPPYVRLGSGRGATVRYPEAALEAWIESSLVRGSE